MKNKNKKLRIVYWNNIPAPYMIERFNTLVTRDKIDLEVWFSQRDEPDRSWAIEENLWKFKYRYLPAIKVLHHNIRFPFTLFGQYKPDLLISLYAEPVYILGWLLSRVYNLKTAFWVEKTFGNWVKRRQWKERLKKILFSKVDAILTAGDDGLAYTLKYRKNNTNIQITPHMIDVGFFHTCNLMLQEDRDILRKEIGLRGTTFLYVGRLWKGKGTIFTLRAFRELQKRIKSDISLLIVGDGIEESYLKLWCIENNLENVIFAGFKQKQQLPRYYTASDVFVFPTLGDPYGLVIDEAMACGLPIITTDMVGELSGRVIDGMNGYIVPAGNSQMLFSRMKQLLSNRNLRRAMGNASFEQIKRFSLNKWAFTFEKAVEEIINSTK